MDADTEITPNSVGWYILEGYPWWPVYICDVTKLRANLYLLGNGHKKILKKARDFPQDFIVVYYFGSHDFSIVSLKKGVLKPWDCAEKDQFLKGHPRQLAKKKGVMEELLESIQEAEEYLSQPEDVRLPQHMVPSDLDPTLEPPPPELAPQEMDVDMEDADEEDAFDEEDAPEDEDRDGDADKKKKKEKKKDKKHAKEKDKRKKSSSKDKKDKKHKKSKSKDAGDDKKRKHSEAENEAAASPSSKVAKTAVETDVKSELAAAKTGVKTEVKPEVVEKKPPPEDLSSEALSIMLEKEIRWILVNCQFEEMTTKTVRKLLEDRLHMDLRHHKPSIKEGVARVIASMEEEDSVEPASTGTAESATPMAESPPKSVKTESNEAAAVTPDAPPVKVDALDEAKVAEEKANAEKEQTKKQLEAAAKDLALDLESNIVKALSSLKIVDNVDKSVLEASGLVPKLVKLRAHRKSNISELVSVLVKKWDVEDLVPAPKPITQEDILDMKTKLEDAETSHDELLGCLNLLGELPLTISQMKKTGIARVVSKLRQHGNDKVSAKAHDLRQMWIKLMNSENATSNDANASRLKTLTSLNRILEQREGAVDYNKQSVALEQLLNMHLQTQDIIESKVGVSVSKLRKSSNETVAKLAKKLRKKWQAQANGA